MEGAPSHCQVTHNVSCMSARLLCLSLMATNGMALVGQLDRHKLERCDSIENNSRLSFDSIVDFISFYYIEST